MSGAIRKEISEIVAACKAFEASVDVSSTAKVFAARYPSYSEAELIEIVMQLVVARRASAQWGKNASRRHSTGAVR